MYTWRQVKTRLWKFLYILVVGQTTSLALTGVGVFTSLFDDDTGKDISTTLSAGAYFIFSATAGPYVAYQPGFVDKIKQYWWKFVIIGIADFYSIYLQTLAFDYTSVSSNLLIVTSFYALFVIILSLFMTKTRYKLIHYISIIVSTSGMVIVFWRDLIENQNPGSNPVLGDGLCVGSGLFYAITTVSEEVLIKGQLTIPEFLAFLGFSGAIVSGIQICVLDRNTLVEVEWSLGPVSYFIGYHICNCIYYIFLALLIMKSSSMITSLSLLTTTVYSLVFAIFLFNNKFSMFYIGGFIIIIFGLILYFVMPTLERDTERSVFSISYWSNYGHSLFCEWKCSQHIRCNSIDVNNNADGDNYNHGDDNDIRLVPVNKVNHGDDNDNNDHGDDNDGIKLVPVINNITHDGLVSSNGDDCNDIRHFVINGDT